MISTINEAKAALESDGLRVSATGPDSLLVASGARQSYDIEYLLNACVLIQTPTGWVAMFPWKGQRAHEIPGPLADLVSLILAVYAEHRLAGGEFGDAATRVLSDPERNPIGRALTQV